MTNNSEARNAGKITPVRSRRVPGKGPESARRKYNFSMLLFSAETTIKKTNQAQRKSGKPKMGSFRRPTDLTVQRETLLS